MKSSNSLAQENQTSVPALLRAPTSALAIYLSICSLLCLFSLGCSRHRAPETTSVRAYRLIDAQRTDEAITLLEASLDKDPNNYDYKVILASAYAHKAGFRIQRLISVMDHIKEMSAIKDPEKLPVQNLKDENTKGSGIEAKNNPSKSSNAPPTTGAETPASSHSELANSAKEQDSISQGQRVDHALSQLNVMLNRFNAATSIYESVPSIRNDELIYLRQAIEILNDLGSEIKQPEALYRGALRIVLFKHILAENLVGEVVAQGFTFDAESSPASNKHCNINAAELNDAIILLGQTLIGVFTDMSIANPKNGKDMMRLADSTAGLISQMTLTTTTLVALNDVSSVVFKQTLLQNGFGKLIRCGGDGPPSQFVSPSGSGR